MLFSSPQHLEPISFMNVNPQLYNDLSYSPTGDFLSKPLNSPMKLLNDFSLDNSTSSSDTGLNESRSKQKQSKNTQPIVNYNPFDHSQNGLIKSVDETNPRGPVYLNPPDHSELSQPKKKVKIDKVLDNNAFEDDFKKSNQYPWNFFDNIDEDLIKKYSSENWLQPSGSDEKLNFWGLIKPSNESSEENAEITQAQDIITQDSLIRSQDVPDKTYFLEIDFAAGLEPPSQPESVTDDEVCIIDAPEPVDAKGSQSESESPAQLVDYSSEPSNRNLQAIKNCLSGVTELDFQRLDPEVYLNDNLINFYLKFIENGLLSDERKKKCHFFNTYFMAQMRKLFLAIDEDYTQFDSIYEKMGKWTKKINIFEKDFLFIPINENEHWNLMILCNPSKLFSPDQQFPYVIFLDSLSRMDNVYAKMLFHYFLRELKAKLPQSYITFQAKVIRFGHTTFPYFQQMVPKQSNMTDCGLYLLQYIEMFAENETPIVQGKEEIDKMRWFPRKLIQLKRDHIKKIITYLNSDQFDIIDEYCHERNQIIKECANKKEEYDSFKMKDFQNTLYRAYGDKVFSDQDKLCLMLDYYYLGTLEYTQMASTPQ